MSRRLSREQLASAAAAASSLVDLMRRLDVHLSSGPRLYLRNRLAHHGIDTSHFADEALPARARQTYTRERLVQAVADAHSLREVMTNLGVTAYAGAYSHLRRRIEHYAISTDHFGEERHGRAGLPSRAALERAVAESQSVAGVLRALGERGDNSAGRTRVNRGIALYGLDTSHFLGQRHYQGSSSTQRLTAGEILRRRGPGSPRRKTALLRRALDESGVNRVCTACGLGEVWQGRRLVLEIDHINGDRLDDRLENLCYLCPTCHSQTRTFGRRRWQPGTALSKEATKDTGLKRAAEDGR